MRKALIIIAAVAGYSLLETGLLLSSFVFHSPWFTAPSTYQSVVYLGQFLLLPGIAALFSRFIYGPHKFVRRTLLILLAGPLGLCVLFTPFAGLAIFLDWTFIVSKILFAVAVTAVMGALVLAVRWCIRKSRRWNVQAEETRWLAERKAGTGPVQRKWRNRGIRFALCIPSTAVLLVFLFLPEIWGALSHLGQPRSGDLIGYRVPVPATWIVLYHGDYGADGKSYVDGIAGRGIGFGMNPLRYDSLSAWSVGTKSFSQSGNTYNEPWMPMQREVVNQRVFTAGGESVTCVDYSWPAYDRVTPRPDAARIAHVSCKGSNRLEASFDGSSVLLPSFYRMLEGIRHVP